MDIRIDAAISERTNEFSLHVHQTPFRNRNNMFLLTIRKENLQQEVRTEVP